MIILFQNQLIEEKDATLSILSPSVMYGFGLFETIKAKGEVVFDLDLHLNRLFFGAKMINLKIKESVEDLRNQVLKIAKIGSIKFKTELQKVKILVFEEGVYLIAQELKIDSKIYEGVKMHSVVIDRALPEVKSTSYLTAYHAHSFAVNQNAYDAILVDRRGFVTEGAYSNIFWFDKNGSLKTTKDNILPGITRQKIIDAHKVQYCDISLEELQKQPEVFLTQSTTGVVPVSTIDSQVVGSGKNIQTESLRLRLFK